MVLTALSSAFLAVWGSNHQPQKGSGEGAGHPQPHHAPCQRQTFLSVPVFPADPSSLPAGMATPTSEGGSILTARDTIHGFWRGSKYFGIQRMVRCGNWGEKLQSETLAGRELKRTLLYACFQHAQGKTDPLSGWGCAGHSLWLKLPSSLVTPSPLLPKQSRMGPGRALPGWVQHSYTCSTSGGTSAYMIHPKEKSSAVGFFSPPWSHLSAAESPPSLPPPAARGQQVPQHCPAF